jgi:hypothetical protein
MRSQRPALRLLGVVCIAALLNLPLFISPPTANAQPLPFLISPYYGSKSINAFFDHNAPFAYDGYILKYTGWPANLSNCNNGPDYCYDGHEGNDFSLVYERVLAAAPGRVMVATWTDLTSPACHAGNRSGCGLGLYVEILHDNGYSTKYGHLSATAVSEGQYVSAGQVIGMSGNTGNSSGPHLHFDVLNSAGKWVDPFGWRGTGADPSGNSIWGGYSWCMWAYGQWANECGGVSTPLTAPTENSTTLVDDQGTGGFSSGCAAGSPCPYPFWIDENTGYNNHLYWATVKNSADGWAKWQPNLSQVGVYEIWVWVSPATTYSNTWQAPYTIQHAHGQSVVKVDQVSTASRWVSVGAYRFNSGTGGYVQLSDYTGEGSGSLRKVRADAVKFVRITPPIAAYQNVYDDPHAQFVYSGTWTRYTGLTGYFGGTTSLSSSSNAYVEFTFIGKQVTWITTKDLNRGIVTVTIDGQNKGTFDLYSPDIQNQHRITFFNLGSGTHTIRITRSNSSPSGFYAEMDALSTQRYDVYLPLIMK